MSAVPARKGPICEVLFGAISGIVPWATTRPPLAYCAQIVLDLRRKNPALNLHCALPCEGQADRWSDSARKRYHVIVARADFEDYVRRKSNDGSMLARNRRLVDQAEILLAVYNGGRRGGTAATVRYARKAGRKFITIAPLIQALTQQ